MNFSFHNREIFKEPLEKYISWIPIIFGLYPITPNNLKPVGIICLLLFGIVKLVIDPPKKNYIWAAILYSSLYLSYIWSLIYTESFDSVGKDLETGLPILLIPIGFFLLNVFENTNIEKGIKRFFITFYCSTLLYSIFTLIYFFRENGLYNINDVNYLRHLISSIPTIGQHPIYASILFCIGVFSSIRLIIDTRNGNKKSFLLIGNLIILAPLFLLASKGVLVAFFISIAFYLMTLVRKKRWKLFVVVSLIGLFTASILFVPTISHRVKELKGLQKENLKITKHNSTSIRKGIYTCAIIKIKENWLLGYGLGDVQSELNECYEVFDTDAYELFDYNTHNQYFNIIMTSGTIALLLFMFLVLSNMVSAVKHGNWLYLTLLIFYAISFLTENILERRSGVILFCFIIGIFSVAKMNKK